MFDEEVFQKGEDNPGGYRESGPEHKLAIVCFHLRLHVGKATYESARKIRIADKGCVDFPDLLPQSNEVVGHFLGGDVGDGRFIVARRLATEGVDVIVGFFTVVHGLEVVGRDPVGDAAEDTGGTVAEGGEEVFEYVHGGCYFWRMSGTPSPLRSHSARL